MNKLVCGCHAGESSLQQIAAALKAHSQALAVRLPGLLLAAAAKLYATAAPLMQNCFSTSHGSTDLMAEVLEGLHEALLAADSSDGILRGSVAIRLALLLEEQGHISKAREVIRQVSGTTR